MFVWLFHRISGLLLVVLLPLQLVTGVLQAGAADVDRARMMGDVHGQGFLNCLLAFLVIFHGAYGVRTVLLDAGFRREKLLFWVCTLAGVMLFLTFFAIWMAVVVR